MTKKAPTPRDNIGRVQLQGQPLPAKPVKALPPAKNVKPEGGKK